MADEKMKLYFSFPAIPHLIASIKGLFLMVGSFLTQGGYFLLREYSSNIKVSDIILS